MTFWVITAVIVVVLAALAWWSSGRAKPGRRDPKQQFSPTEADHVVRHQGGRLGNGPG